MAKSAICFDCGVGGLIGRLRRFLKIFQGGGKGRHCENCGRHLEEHVEAWVRARDSERDASARNPHANPADRPPRKKA
jgi:hypothetical protein